MMTKEDRAPKIHWWQEAAYGDVRWKMWAVFLSIGLAIAIAAAVSFAGAEIGDSIGCRNKANTMGLPYRWSVTTSCMVNPGDGYVPLDNYRVTQTTP